MGYFKNTMYYGPCGEDWSDNSPEARAERRRSSNRPFVGRWPDKDTCLICETKAPAGKLWTEGICDHCRSLSTHKE